MSDTETVVLVVRRPPPEVRRQEGFTVFPVKMRHDLVSEVSIPKFSPPADVLHWGTRTFRRSSERWDDKMMYVEALAYVIPDQP